MASKDDGINSNILSFPDPSVALPAAADIRENVVTIEGVVLMHAFLKIASSEDRRRVIALAEQLGGRDDRTAKE